jgi:repressor LexA
MNKHGMPPTVREVGDALGIESSSAFYLLETLRTKGFLERGDLGARSLRLSSQGKEAPTKRILRLPPEKKTTTTARVPLIGTVSAGHPILAQENWVGDVWVSRELAARGKCFALEIKGDSMTGAGIHDGDIVIARQQPLAQDGEIVVALLGEEATVKELSMRGDRIELRPKNPAYRAVPIGPEDDFQVLGKVIAAAPGQGPHITRRD